MDQVLSAKGGPQARVVLLPTKRFNSHRLSTSSNACNPTWQHDDVSHVDPRRDPIPHLKSVPIAYESQSVAPFKTRLTSEQLEALRRCAKGISLRFEARAIVNALVDGGYAEIGVAGVVNVTTKGEEYLRTHASPSSPPLSRFPCLAGRRASSLARIIWPALCYPVQGEIHSRMTSEIVRIRGSINSRSSDVM